MILAFDAEADADLRDIGDWIAADNPERAASFLLELRARCSILTVSFRRFPLVSRNNTRELRKLIHKRYLIFYTISGERVRVIRVLHGARNSEGMIEQMLGQAARSD